MIIRGALLGVGAVALANLVAGCSDPPLPATAAAFDATYGIPYGSVPVDYRRSDGLLNNGLLPVQPDG
jgi:hypothetical protein